jgi:hypothetical protein
MDATQSRDCERFSQWLVFFPPTTARAAASNMTSRRQLTITTFAIRGLMPVIYFKLISQLDDSGFKKAHQ